MVKINLLPWREIERNKKIRLAFFCASVGLLIILIGLVGGYVYLKKELKEIRAEIVVAQKNAERIEKQNKKAEQVLEVNQLLQSVNANNNNLMRNLNALFVSVPIGVIFSKLEYVQGAWGVEGHALDQTKLLAWVKRLEEKNLFNNIDFKKWKVGDEVVNFSLKENHK